MGFWFTDWLIPALDRPISASTTLGLLVSLATLFWLAHRRWSVRAETEKATLIEASEQALREATATSRTACQKQIDLLNEEIEGLRRKQTATAATPKDTKPPESQTEKDAKWSKQIREFASWNPGGAIQSSWALVEEAVDRALLRAGVSPPTSAERRSRALATHLKITSEVLM